MTVKNGKAYLYQRKGSADYRAALHAHLSKHIPQTPFDGPIACHLSFFYPPTQTVQRKVQNNSVVYKTTKPDCDNLAKQVLDVMQELDYFKDDSQVCELHICKYYSAMPYIQIGVYEKE